MTDHEPIATAWSIHSALIDWTGKVDNKASFALTIESAALAGTATLSGDGHRLNRLHGFWPLGLYWAGLFALIVGVCVATWVVRPNLRRRNVSGEASTNFIYFGHLKAWNADDLELALKQRELLPVLSRQLVRMSEIAWRKHRGVQLSMSAGIAGTILVGLAAIAR